MTNRDTARFILAIVLAIVIGSMLAVLTSGCVRRHSPDACVRAFREELISCVKESNTREEYEACREKTEIEWGHPHD